jgi:hypothetical protein
MNVKMRSQEKMVGKDKDAGGKKSSHNFFILNSSLLIFHSANVLPRKEGFGSPPLLLPGGPRTAYTIT